MRVIDEQAFRGLRVRVATFDGDHALVFMQPSEVPFPNAGGLWVTLTVCSLAAVERQLAGLRENDLSDEELLDTVRRGIALFGLTWSQLQARQSVCAEQCARWSQASFERVAPGLLWEIRGRVFGAPLTRVVRAAVALDLMYVPEEPVSREDLLAVFADG